MVHVRKCPCKSGRGRPVTEFHIKGKPQIYCFGRYDMMTEEALPICKKCADWVDGEQIEKDYEEAKKKGIIAYER